jgi:hypothetical protein
MGTTKGAGNGWKRQPVNPFETGSHSVETWCYRKIVRDGMLTVLTTPDEGAGYHLSISHAKGGKPDRYPSWDEIIEARDRFTPSSVEMVMYLPTKEEYVNLHETCFHLWSVPKDDPTKDVKLS